MNTLFVLLDGMEDDPNPLFGGRKPYETARMPFMHSKAKHRMYTTGRGYTQLFLNEYFTGHPPDTPRAALEAMGLGLNVSDGRTAYRLSPAEIKDGMIRWSYHADVFCDELMSRIRGNMHILERYKPEIEFFLNGRAVLTMECDDDIPDLPSPPVDAPFVDVPGDLGALVMRIAEEMDGITDYPWGCGKLGQLHPPFPCLGDMTAVSDSPTALGVAASLGHRIHLIKDLEERFPVAKEALRHGNVFLHIDEVDEYSHQKDPDKKVKVLEQTDRLMSEHFRDTENIVYFVDHGTSSITGEHIIMDVPFWTSMETDMKDGEHVPLDQVVPRLLGQNR